MVTKSGKHHFTCEFRLYEPDGTLIYEDRHYTFVTKDPDEYIYKHRVGYIHRRAEFTNVIDLDANINPVHGIWEYTHGVWACSKCGKSPNENDCWTDDSPPSFPCCPWCGYTET